MALNLVQISKIGVVRVCCLHTTNCYGAKVGKAMRKVLGTATQKKSRYTEDIIMPKSSAFSQGSLEGRYSGNSRRASVLNKLFMRHITDLMATGENSAEFLGHGIEINRVKITPDFNGLNIFWVARGSSDDEEVERILQRNAGYLRHELSSLRVVGVVPTMRFVKDKHYSKIIEIDSRLAKADFGEDHEPISIETRLKSQFELHTPLSQEIREKISSIDGESVENEDELEEPLPPMPQDVLGLNHSEILNRIEKQIKKSRATHRLNNMEDYSSSHTINDNPIEYSSQEEQRAAFRDFLQKRELLRSKSKKLDKNYFPDLEYLKQESKDRDLEYFKNMDIYDQDEYTTIDDYVSDDECDKQN